MKKMLMLVVPLAMLVAFASVSLATEEATQNEQELNQELNQELSGENVVARDDASAVDDDTEVGDNDLNGNNRRDTRAVASKRGRQPRRGQTASGLGSVQKYWGDSTSGKSGSDEMNDEMPDEDEDPDETQYYN